MLRLLATSLMATAFLYSQSVLAEKSYRFELSGAVNEGSVDIQNGTTDTEGSEFQGKFYLEAVTDNEEFPIAESAYVGKADFLSIDVADSETKGSFTTSRGGVTTRTNINTEQSQFKIGYNLVTENDKIWRIQLAQQEFSSLGSSIEFNGIGLSWGSYISDSSSFELNFQKNFYDGDRSGIEDTHNIGLSFRSIKALEESGFFGFDIAIDTRKENALSAQTVLTTTVVTFKPEYYINRSFSVFGKLSAIRNNAQHTKLTAVGLNYHLASIVHFGLEYQDLSFQPRGNSEFNGDSLILKLSLRI